MDDDEAGAKYAYLLQPIKDLDRNFAIDIVGLLETYQKQLAQLAEDVEFQRDNAHRFNFAEAAMLIQGSVSVFGKKVDHVYTQAMNFFDTLKTTKDKKKKNGDAAAADDEGFGGEDDENADPLAMMAVDPCQLQDMSRVKPANLTTLALKHRGADIPSISIMPMSLMPLADFEKCNVPIFNSKNKSEIVGKKDDFKINTGYMCGQGALLLDLLNERLVDKFVEEELCHELEKTVLAAADNDSGRGSPAGMDYDDAELAADVSINLPGEGAAGRVSSASVIEMNRRATGGRQTLDGFPNRPSTGLLLPGPIISQPILEVVESMCGGGDENDFFDDEPLPVKLEPWQADPCGVDSDVTVNLAEDPYEEVQWKHKPLKPINCHVNPLVTINRRKKDNRNMGQREKIMEMINYVNENFYYQGKRQRAKKQLGISWEKSWDTDALFPFIMEQQKRREKQKREEQAKRRAEAGAVVVPAAADDDDDFGSGGFDDDDLMEGQPLRHSLIQRRFADIGDEEINISINIPSLYVGKAPNADEPFGDEAPIDVERPHTAMSLTELLDFYMKRYWTEAAEATSRLAARVQEWDEKMQPLLEEEETRKEFDIHEYGGELLQLFRQDKQDKSLPELLKQKKDYEISRYFLSCLMMANTLNVEIVNEQQTGPDPLKMMRVKLLKRDRHHEVFNQAGAL